MIDLLFKFNVLSTAISTIISETNIWLGNLGGRWFHIFTAWILYTFVEKYRNDPVTFEVHVDFFSI